jgi:hypothetical protein
VQVAELREPARAREHKPANATPRAGLLTTALSAADEAGAWLVIFGGMFALVATIGFFAFFAFLLALGIALLQRGRTPAEALAPTSAH